MPSIGMIRRTFGNISAVRQRGEDLRPALMNSARLVSFLSEKPAITSLEFSVIWKRKGEDLVPRSLSLITGKKNSEKTIRLNAFMGKTLYRRYGITGFTVKRGIDQNVVYDFFLSIVSHKRIDPEELAPKGITLAFSNGIE